MKQPNPQSSLCILSALVIAACSPATDNSLVFQELPAALVVTTDYQSGAFSVIDLNSRAVHRDVDIIHHDTVCRTDPFSHRVFLVQRQGADSVAIVDPQDHWQITREYSVGPGTNPQDIAVVSTEKAYVTRFNKPDILIIHPDTGQELGQIPLGQFADSDGLPEAGWMLLHGQRVFVALMLLDAPGGYIPGPRSAIAVIDTQTDTVEKVIETTWSNPAARMRFNTALNRIIAVESGSFTAMRPGDPLFGGIEFLNPETLVFDRAIIDEVALGGDLVDAVIIDENTGFAIIGIQSNGNPATNFISFNPSTGQQTGILAQSNQWAFANLEVSPDTTTLWLSDRTRNRPGIRFFSAHSQTEIDAEPASTGLPPGQVCFISRQHL